MSSILYRLLLVTFTLLSTIATANEIRQTYQCVIKSEVDNEITATTPRWNVKLHNHFMTIESRGDNKFLQGYEVTGVPLTIKKSSERYVNNKALYTEYALKVDKIQVRFIVDKNHVLTPSYELTFDDLESNELDPSEVVYSCSKR